MMKTEKMEMEKEKRKLQLNKENTSSILHHLSCQQTSKYVFFPCPQIQSYSFCCCFVHPEIQLVMKQKENNHANRFFTEVAQNPVTEHTLHSNHFDSTSIWTHSLLSFYMKSIQVQSGHVVALSKPNTRWQSLLAI